MSIDSKKDFTSQNKHQLLTAAILILSFMLIPFVPSHAVGPSGKIVVWITLEGMDGMMVMEPDNATFRTRRERVAFPLDDLLGAYTQSGHVPRRFNERTPILHNRMASNELAVVQRVGFSDRYCSQSKARELLDRGVDRLDHPHTNGWVDRMGEKFGWSDTSYAWDLNGDSLAFEGGNYSGSSFSDINSARVNTRQHVYDSDMREETGFSTHSAFAQKSMLAARLADHATSLMSGLYEIREMGGEIGGYQGFPIGVVLRKADLIIRTRSEKTRIIYARIPRIFKTGEDQRDYYSGELARLEHALNRFILNMEATGHWGKVILVLAPDYGRTIPATGRIPAGTNDADGDPRGTACGHAGDVFVLGDTNTINGGFHGQGFSASDLSSAEFMTPRITFTQLQHAVVDALGYNADSIIDREGKPVISNVFK